MRIITNGNIAITTYMKCASSNLQKFFTPTKDQWKEHRNVYANPNTSRKFKDIKYSDKKGGLDIKRSCTLIVVTRNEFDRWCSGVVQDIVETFSEEKVDYGDLTMDAIANTVKHALIDTTQYINLFMGGKYGHSHVGQDSWIKNITSIGHRPNTHFIDISSLSDRSFWERVCELDNTWPPVDHWWSLWEKECGPNDFLHPKKMVTEWIMDVLHKHENLKQIKKILESNQEIIENIKKEMSWWSIQDDEKFLNERNLI